jgi:hypothetical protein
MYSSDEIQLNSVLQSHFCKILFPFAFISKDISTPKFIKCTLNQWSGSAIIQRLVTQRKGKCFVCIIHIPSMNAYRMTTATIGRCQNTKQEMACIQPAFQSKRRGSRQITIQEGSTIRACLTTFSRASTTAPFNISSPKVSIAKASS